MWVGPDGALRQLEKGFGWAPRGPLPCPTPPYLVEDEHGHLPRSHLLALQGGQQLAGHCLDLPAAVMHHGPGARGQGRVRARLAGKPCARPPGTTDPAGTRWLEASPSVCGTIS